MMGTKERAFGPLPAVTLEELVPPDHFYRHLERTIDLGFVRDLVREAYATIGRPSIDPVVFFKLQLILFFEDLRSERQLMQVVADRLSLRWYLGYDLTEPLPDHSSLTRIRERYGLAVLQTFFERIVEQCMAAGLVWGQELYFDATKVEANASLDSVAPRRMHPRTSPQKQMRMSWRCCRSHSPQKHTRRWPTPRPTAMTGSARPGGRIAP